MMWSGGEVGWTWLIGGDVFCCTSGSGLLVPGVPDVPGLPGLLELPGFGFQVMLGWLLLLLLLGHVELVLLPLVPLLVLERHLLKPSLRLRIRHRPTPAEFLCAIPDPHPRIESSHLAALLVGKPHEAGNVPLRGVRVFLGSRPPPPPRVRLHHVLLLLAREPAFILSGHLVVLGTHLGRRLCPPLPELLAKLSDPRVWHYLPHLHPLLVREHHEAAERSFRRVRVLLGSRLLVTSLRTHVVLRLLLPEPLLVVVGHLLKHGPGHLVQGVPPPAQLLGDVRHREVGVGRLDLCTAHVREVEETGKRPFWSVWIPMRFLGDVAVVVVVSAVLDVPLHTVLLLLVPVQNSRLGGFVAAHVTRITYHLVLGPLVELEVDLGGSNVLTLVTVELGSRMLGELVP